MAAKNGLSILFEIFSECSICYLQCNEHRKSSANVPYVICSVMNTGNLQRMFHMLFAV